MEKEFFLKTLKDFLSKMGYGEDLTVNQKDLSNETVFEIETQEAKYLIGEKGSNLASLEFLVKLVCQKQNIDTNRVFIDINNYRKERANFLREVAKTSAQKAVLTGSPVSFPPMQAFDRKIVHTELALNLSIKTESEGFGEERKVIIKPNLN